MSTFYYVQAMKAIRAVFNDTSVTPDETISHLKGLIDEIYVMIDSLKSEVELESDEEEQKMDKCPYCGSDDITYREDGSGFDCENCWKFVPMEYVEEWESRNNDD